MKSLIALLSSLACLVLNAAEVPLAWDASSTVGVTNITLYASTGTLTTNTLATATVKLQLGVVTTATLKDFLPGRWSFCVTAWKDGLQSDPSNILQVEVPLPPNNMRTVAVQYAGEITVPGTNWVDVGFFKIKLTK